jgi:hypothetical protein
MDVFTFRQLKESKYYDPILTEVMFDYDMMLEMVFHSMTIIEKGYDTVWDANMFNFTRMYFQEGIEYVEKLITDKGIRIRLIVEATLENIDAIDSLNRYYAFIYFSLKLVQIRFLVILTISFLFPI